MKVAYLVHGCFLQANAWENIIWGTPAKDEWGRASLALRLAAHDRDALFIWGTGASEIDGVKECEYTFNYAVGRAKELPEYQGFDSYEILSMLQSRSVFDKEAQNTGQEIENAVRLCRERGIDTLFLISSPTHIARCMNEAEKVRAASNNRHAVTILARASDTCFEGSTPNDVIIVEPPHRGDMPLWQSYRYVGAMFSIMRQGKDVFEKFLADFGKLLENYGVTVNWRPIREKVN